MYDETLDGNSEVPEQKICVMKRSGERVPFDPRKIANAIEKANREEGIASERLSPEQIEDITEGIMKDAQAQDERCRSEDRRRRRARQ